LDENREDISEPATHGGILTDLMVVSSAFGCREKAAEKITRADRRLDFCGQPEKFRVEQNLIEKRLLLRVKHFCDPRL
jgi:hypothetical protein